VLTIPVRYATLVHRPPSSSRRDTHTERLEEPVDENISTCVSYLKRMAPMKQWLEMEIGITVRSTVPVPVRTSHGDMTLTVTAGW
jgi:fructose/tagatose bisphosphate aldolase